MPTSHEDPVSPVTATLERSGKGQPPGAPAAVQKSAVRWFVLHTRSRQEKQVAASLQAMGTEHFLPLFTQVRTHGRRRFSSELPLFPGYLFLRGTLEQAYDVDRTRRIVQIITVTDQDRLDWELRNIQLAVEGEASLDPYPYLREGCRAVVKSGPLRGVEGWVHRGQQSGVLVLQVQTLGRAVSVQMDAAALEPLE